MRGNSPSYAALPAAKFVAVESWRGIAAIMVILAHFRVLAISHLNTLPLVANGHLFVDFFFVLSGFVITHAYGPKIGISPDIVPFAIRRFGRLWPLHAAILALWIAVLVTQFVAGHMWIGNARPIFSADRTGPGLLGSLFLVQGLLPWRGSGWNEPSWTISVEFWICLVFAFANLLPWRREAVATGLGLFGLFVMLVAGARMDVTSGFGFFRGLYGFFVGSLAYHAYGRWALPTRLSPAWSEASIFLLAVLVIWISGSSALAFAAPPVFAAVIIVFAQEAGPLSRLLRRRPFVAFGAWSYSIYLIHLLLMAILVSTLRRLAGQPFRDANHNYVPLILHDRFVMDGLAVLTVATTLGVSCLTYHWIERPARDYFNRLAGRLALRREAVA